LEEILEETTIFTIEQSIGDMVEEGAKKVAGEIANKSE